MQLLPMASPPDGLVSGRYAVITETPGWQVLTTTRNVNVTRGHGARRGGAKPTWGQPSEGVGGTCGRLTLYGPGLGKTWWYAWRWWCAGHITSGRLGLRARASLVAARFCPASLASLVLCLCGWWSVLPGHESHKGDLRSPRTVRGRSFVSALMPRPRGARRSASNRAGVPWGCT